MRNTTRVCTLRLRWSSIAASLGVDKGRGYILSKPNERIRCLASRRTCHARSRSDFVRGYFAELTTFVRTSDRFRCRPRPTIRAYPTVHGLIFTWLGKSQLSAPASKHRNLSCCGTLRRTRISAEPHHRTIQPQHSPSPLG